MLSKVLSKETCAKCRFCCSFRRCSLWETPLFPKNECEKLSKDNEYGVKSDFQMQGEYGQMKLYTNIVHRIVRKKQLVITLMNIRDVFFHKRTNHLIVRYGLLE